MDSSRCLLNPTAPLSSANPAPEKSLGIFAYSRFCPFIIFKIILEGKLLGWISLYYFLRRHAILLGVEELHVDCLVLLLHYGSGFTITIMDTQKRAKFVFPIEHAREYGKILLVAFPLQRIPGKFFAYWCKVKYRIRKGAPSYTITTTFWKLRSFIWPSEMNLEVKFTDFWPW